MKKVAQLQVLKLSDTRDTWEPVGVTGNDSALTRAVADDIRALRREVGNRAQWDRRGHLEFLMSMGLTQPEPAERKVLLRHALYYCHPVISSR